MIYSYTYIGIVGWNPLEPIKGVDTPLDRVRKTDTPTGGWKIIIEKRIIDKFTLHFWTRHPLATPITPIGGPSMPVLAHTDTSSGNITETMVILYNS